MLSDSNIKLQVENQILKQRMEPLLSIEKQVIAQEDVEMQGVLVSQADLGVMRQVLTQVGNDIWKEIRNRLEVCVQKPFNTLKEAFVSEYEDELIRKVQSLENHLVQMQEENMELRKQVLEKKKMEGMSSGMVLQTPLEAYKDAVDFFKSDVFPIKNLDDDVDMGNIEGFQIVKYFKPHGESGVLKTEKPIEQVMGSVIQEQSDQGSDQVDNIQNQAQ